MASDLAAQRDARQRLCRPGGKLQLPPARSEAHHGHCRPPRALRLSPPAWYADLEIDAGPSYNPFVRLALVRVQPYAVGDCALSTVAHTQYAQLLPTRELHLDARRANLMYPTGVRHRAGVSGRPPPAANSAGGSMLTQGHGRCLRPPARLRPRPQPHRDGGAATEQRSRHRPRLGGHGRPSPRSAAMPSRARPRRWSTPARLDEKISASSEGHQ